MAAILTGRDELKKSDDLLKIIKDIVWWSKTFHEHCEFSQLCWEQINSLRPSDAYMRH